MSGSGTKAGASHTPGPWKVIEPDEFTEPWRKDVCHFQDNGDCITVANVRVAPPIGETEANARLIAVAPELLDFVRNVAATQCSTHYFHGQAEELISKAEGLGGD